MGEVHSILILAKKTIYGRILHRNRKGGILGVFRSWQEYHKRKMSP